MPDPKLAAISQAERLWQASIVLFILLMFWAFWKWVSPDPVTLPAYLWWVGPLLSASVLIHAVIPIVRRRLASVQIPARLGRGECPGCLYALAGLPAEPIGHLGSALRCPECGAVWRSDRIGQADQAKKKPRAEPGA